MTALAVLVGVSLTLTGVLIIGVAYVFWRYNWEPWKVVRRDLAALNDRLGAIRQELDQIRKAEVFSMMSNEELASIERRLLHRSRSRATGGEAGRG